MNSGKVTKTILGLLVVALLAPGLLMAATGKIRGTVVDAETKAPLFGANVLINGSSMGAATDVNGNYIILNVPAGRYSMSVQYMGYAKLTVENIIVAEGITTFRDFELSQSVLEGQEVVIVAQRPLIEKGETNEVHRLSAEDLENMPIRGVNAAVATMAGVVQDGANLYVRGGRSGEMAFYVDGVNITRPLGGDANNFTVIQNAVELVQTQTGGFSAQYGGKMSGVTSTTIKSGSAKYKLTGELISDDFWAVEDDRGAYQILGLKDVYSFGYNDYVLTLGGPLVPGYDKVRFYLAGQSWNRASGATQFQGFQQDSLQLIQNWFKSDGSQVTDTLDYFVDVAPGRLPGNTNNGWLVNSNVVFDFKPFRVRTGFNYSFERNRTSTSQPTALTTTPLRPYDQKWHTWNAYINMTHTLDPTAFYTLTGSYWSREYEGADVVWGDDMVKWGDPDLNPALLEASVTRSYDLPYDDAWTIVYPNTPSFAYTKSKETKWQFKVDFTKQFGKVHEVQFGGELVQETIRSYNLAARRLYRRLQDVALNPELYTDYDIYSGLNLRMIGYDFLGEEVDDDQHYETLQGGLTTPVSINARNAPMNPLTASAYFQDQIELKDMIINFGVRFDHIRNGWWSLNDATLLTQTTGGVLSDDDIGPEKRYNYVSPRLGFSFPVTDQAVFSAAFGKYVQAADPNEIWAKTGYTTYMSQLFRSSYFQPLPNPNLEPEQNTSYEFGFQMQFGANASLDVTAFYRDTRELLTMNNIVPQSGATYAPPTLSINGDFGTVKGVTATFNLRRTSRITAQTMYTYQIAQGTGSNVGSHTDIAWQESDPQFPKVIQALDFDQRHKATVVVDVRTQAEDGPEMFGTHPLGGIGMNFQFDVHSGQPYTKIGIDDALSQVYGYNAPKPLGAPNSSNMPWFYQLNGKISKAFKVGPVNMRAYIWAINMLNTKSITGVFRQTGRPDSDGWLLTAEGQKKIADKGEEFVKWYQADLTNCGTVGYQAPRQIRFGLWFGL